MTTTAVDKKTLTITFQRTFAAPREEVFEAWTNPNEIRLWWDPRGTPLAHCAVDLRPGGSFSFVHASGHAPPFAGVYRIVEPPAYLEFDAMGAIGTVKLEATRDTTLMTVSIRSPSADHFEQFLKLGVEVGTAKTLDNLVAHVGRQH